MSLSQPIYAGYEVPHNIAIYVQGGIIMDQQMETPNNREQKKQKTNIQFTKLATTMKTLKINSKNRLSCNSDS